MNVDKKDISLQKSFFSSLFLWLCVSTWKVASYTAPEWADGAFYLIWWGLVFWAILITSMTPVGFVVIVSCKLFKLPGALGTSFCFVWFFDYIMTKNYPMLAITPGVALSALYVFVVLKQKGYIKI